MLHRRNLVLAHDNSNKPTINRGDNFRLVELEAARGPQGGGLQHVSVPVRRVLARALAAYRDRTWQGGTP